MILEASTTAPHALLQQEQEQPQTILHLLSPLAPPLAAAMKPVTAGIVLDTSRSCITSSLGSGIFYRSNSDIVPYRRKGTYSLQSQAPDNVLYTAYNKMFLPSQKKILSPALSANVS
jgi:hypothetical protein